jgi:hypothetical protein
MTNYDKQFCVETKTVFDEISRVSGILEIVPEQYREKVLARAKQDSGGQGFTEYYERLKNLIYIFKD